MPAFPSMVVVRVKSDSHKYEFACVTLAEETLQEETAFFTTFYTQDKSSISQETDLNIIRPLLDQRYWFGFDLQQVSNILHQLYGSINQAPPHPAGMYEGYQMFEEAFSQPCDSLYSAAERLHILPRNKRNLNARAECDIACEIISQIALNWTTRPSQNVASPSSEDPMNKSQERINTQHEHVPHEMVNPNIGTTDNMEVPAQGFRSAAGHEEKEERPTSSENARYHATYNTKGTTFGTDYETTYNEPNQQFVTEENVTEAAHAEFTHKRKDAKHLDAKTETQDSHVAERENRVQASWKDLAKGKLTSSTPSRPQLHVIPGVVQKKPSEKPSGQGRYKFFPPARDPQTIKQIISNVINAKRTVWISYEGGHRPLIPRGVTPTRWDDSGNNSAFFGVAFHSKTGNETKFVLKQVKEVRERSWSRPEDANANTNRGTFKNETKNGRSEEKHSQGASKHEDGSKNSGADKSKTNGHNKPRPNKVRK